MRTNRMAKAWIAAAVGAALALAACGSTDDPEAASSASAETTESTADTGAGSSTATSATGTSASATSSGAATATTAAMAASWPLTAPAASLPATVTDATGASVTVTSIERIASLQGDITEILWTLGLADRIAVVDTTSVYPASILQQKPNAGFFRTLAAEGLLAQNPTVVLAHPGAGPVEVIDAVRNAGVPVVFIPELNGTDLAEAGQKIRLVGAAVGLADHAETLASQVEEEITAATAAAKAAAKGSPVAAYIVPRGQQVFLTGMDNPSNAIITAAGGTPAAKVLNLDKAAPLTPEALIGAQPEFVISTFTGVEQAGGEAAFLGIAGIAESPAGQNKQLIVFDDSFIQQFGPRTGQAVTALAERLHGS
ncbi:MAG: ABC transporter substrate-binding protein [Acidimicrobiales bacterium]|nr:ABC transporter substrate-binding protein [Acidimicrobiales bacterium]